MRMAKARPAWRIRWGPGTEEGSGAAIGVSDLTITDQYAPVAGAALSGGDVGARKP